MGDLIKQYATDPRLEEEGVWIDVDSSDAPQGERSLFRIVPDDHPAVKQALDEHQREFAQFYMRGGRNVPDHVRRLGEVRCTAAAIREWKNVELDGAIAPPTRENKERVMREVRFLREQVLILSGRTETFRRELVAEVGKG